MLVETGLGCLASSLETTFCKFNYDRLGVIEAHGYGMRFRLTIVSIHVAKVQICKTFQLQRSSSVTKLLTDEDLRSYKFELWLCECSLSSI